MSIQVYTAIYGNSDVLNPLPSGVSGVCFTDNVNLHGGWLGDWEMRYEPLHHLCHPRLRAKLWKVRPDLAGFTDTTLWMDGSMQLRPGALELMQEELDGDEAMFFAHHWRDCIYDEVPASFGGRPLAYEGQTLQEQVDHYRTRMRVPEHAGLFASGCMLRRDTPAVRAFNQRWWDEICRWSTQDQLSMTIAARAIGELKWRHFPRSMVEQEYFYLHQHTTEN